MYRHCKPLRPCEYKPEKNSGAEAIRVPPYFPASHPNTVWLINRMRSGHAAPVVKILKSREAMAAFFKDCHFQLLDKPSLYDPSNTLDRPMFNDKAYLFLDVFAVALYFRCEMIVRSLSGIRVPSQGSQSYRSLCDPQAPQYAAYVYDHSFGDMMEFNIIVLMMRREAYFAVPHMLNFGEWNPQKSFDVKYFRRSYQSARKFNDWLDYAWKLLEERPTTRISHLVSALSAAAHKYFYLGKKIKFSPVLSVSGRENKEESKTCIHIYRSFARRVLCHLFLNKEPLSILPQVVPFIRVFQRERFFVAQTAQAMLPEFRKKILGSLATRLAQISPLEPVIHQSFEAYCSTRSHELSVYDFDNIVALLLHFLVLAADRHVASLRDSLIRLVMDILVDTELVFCFSAEPAVNISYYLSLLVDGPFIQPYDLQLMLKNIPVLLLNQSAPRQLFPELLHVDWDKLQKIDGKTVTHFHHLKTLWDKPAGIKKVIRSLMEYRCNVDESRTKSISHTSWKNNQLRKRMHASLLSLNSQLHVEKDLKAAFIFDCEPNHHIQGWMADTYFDEALKIFVEGQSNDVVDLKKGEDCLRKWKLPQLEDPDD